MDALPAAAGIDDAGERSVHWVCDQTDHAQIDEFVGRVVDRFGRLDILVNNAAAVMMPVPHAEDVPELLARIQGAPGSDDAYERTALFHAFAIQSNLISPLWFAIRAYRAMIEHRDMGSIINISSAVSHAAGAPTLVSYGAAKAGLNHLTRSLAEEWGPQVRVNCLALGPTMTESYEAFVDVADGSEAAEYFKKIPLGRAGTPDEVGAACVFLCSGQADSINGTTIEMDGGMFPGVFNEQVLRSIEGLLAADRSTRSNTSG